jgi:hypothetical protein
MPTKLAVDQIVLSPQTIEGARQTIAIIGRGRRICWHMNFRKLCQSFKGTDLTFTALYLFCHKDLPSSMSLNA